MGGREHTCTRACVFSFSQFGCHWSMLKPKYSFPAPSPFLLCTHHLTRRQMKPFKYLFIVSSVPIRPCHSCHAPHVSLKHNAINTSSALMDASHMNALMKCVIVSPHRTLTIYCRRHPWFCPFPSTVTAHRLPHPEEPIFLICHLTLPSALLYLGTHHRDFLNLLHWSFFIHLYPPSFYTSPHPLPISMLFLIHTSDHDFLPLRILQGFLITSIIKPKPHQQACNPFIIWPLATFLISLFP